jgi:hypothetical protein
MITDFVERTDVSPCQRGALLRSRGAFFVKNLEPQPLRLADLPARRRQPDFKRAETPKHRWQAGKIAHDPARFYEGGGVPDGTAETGRRRNVPHQPTNLVLFLWIESRSRTRRFDDERASSTGKEKRRRRHQTAG